MCLFDLVFLLFCIQCLCVAFHFVHRPLAFFSFLDVYVRMRFCVCVFLLYCFLGCNLSAITFITLFLLFIIYIFSSLIWTIGLIQINDLFIYCI